MRMKEIILDQIKPGSLDLKGHQGDSDIGRLLATFRGEKTDRVPNFEILIEDQHVEKLLGRYAGNTLALGGESGNLCLLVLSIQNVFYFMFDSF